MNVPKDAKRQEIKDRIAAAQARNEERTLPAIAERAGERAVEAKDEFVESARKHPVALVAGGLAIGILVSALFKNSPTRRAGRVAGAKAAGIAAMGSEMALAFAEQVMEAGGEVRRASADRLEDAGHVIGDTSRKLRRETSYRAGGLGDAARSTARDIGKSLARSFRRH